MSETVELVAEAMCKSRYGLKLNRVLRKEQVLQIRREAEDVVHALSDRLAGPDEVVARPKVITLCGSSRFIDLIAVCAWMLERDEGAITMSMHFLPGWYTDQNHHLAEHQGVADRMDSLHLKKIEMSDEIFVVNAAEYIGKSTRNEIEFAEALGKPIRYFMDDPIRAKIASEEDQ